VRASIGNESHGQKRHRFPSGAHQHLPESPERRGQMQSHWLFMLNESTEKERQQGIPYARAAFSQGQRLNRVDEGFPRRETIRDSRKFMYFELPMF
jgi:hypothetical protein